MIFIFHCHRHCQLSMSTVQSHYRNKGTNVARKVNFSSSPTFVTRRVEISENIDGVVLVFFSVTETAFEDGLSVLVVPSALLRIDQHFVRLLHFQKLGFHFFEIVRIFIWWKEEGVGNHITAVCATGTRPFADTMAWFVVLARSCSLRRALELLSKMFCRMRRSATLFNFFKAVSQSNWGLSFPSFYSPGWYLRASFRYAFLMSASSASRATPRAS